MEIKEKRWGQMKHSENLWDIFIDGKAMHLHGWIADVSTGLT